MSSTAKAVIFWLTIIISAFLFWQTVRTGGSRPPAPEISYSEFLTRIANGQVSSVTIAGNEVRARDPKGSGFRVIAPPNQSAMLDALQEHGVEIWFKDQPAGNWPTWILNLAPLIMLAALWFFMIRQMQARSRKASPGIDSSTSPGTQIGQNRF
jgi:cell division protease FtsH